MWEDLDNVGVLRVLRRCLLSSTLTRTAVDLKLWGGLEDRFRTNIGPNIIEAVSVFRGTRTFPLFNAFRGLVI